MGPGVILVLLAYLLPAVVFFVVLYFVVLAAVRTALREHRAALTLSPPRPPGGSS